MSNKLFQHIRKFIDLNANDELVINKYISTLHLKKKEFLFQTGNVCKDMYFVEKGCL